MLYALNKTIYYAVFLFLLTLNSYGQNYADTSYYLVDSLDLSKLSEFDRNLIDSSLRLYHKENVDTSRLNALNIIVEESWDVNVWPRYNRLVLEKTEKLLKQSSESTVHERLLNIKINAINNIGYFHEHNSNYEESLRYYEQAYALCILDVDSTLLAVILNNIGSVNKRMGNSITAIKYYERSLRIKKLLNDSLGSATTLNNIGVLYRNLGDIDGALNKYYESIEILQAAGELKKVAVIKSNIGIIYLDQSDTTTALTFLNESLKISEKINDERGEAITRGNISSIYINRKDSIRAMKELSRCLTIYTNLDEPDGIANVKGRIGNLYSKLKNRPLAKLYINEALKLYESIGSKNGIAVQSYLLGELYFEEGNINNAEFYGVKSYNAAKVLGYPSMLVDAAKLLSKVYKQKHNWEKAFEYSELLNIYKDSVNSIEIYNRTQTQLTNFKLREHKKENELLRAKNELLTKSREVNQLELQKSNYAIWFISFIIIALVIVVILVLRALKKQRQISHLLRRQRNLSHSKEKQKESMLKEIHHRVKNNLQIVRSLLRLQSMNANDPRLDQYFTEAQNRISSMALIHEKMYGSTDLKKLHSNAYFENLVNGIVESYTLEKNVKVNIDVDEFGLDLDTLVPLGLLINEIISNSMKYAFGDVEDPLIQLKLSQNGKKCILEIADNGCGFSQDKVDKGLGSDLIESFTSQLEGELKVESHKGTKYILEFMLQM